MAKQPSKKQKAWLFPVRQEGQSLLEYVLISTLIIIGLAVSITLAGNAITDVFEYQVAHLLDLTIVPESTMSEGEFWDVVTAVASYTPDTVRLITNTPGISSSDPDNDGVPTGEDNCPTTYNPLQENTTGSTHGDACNPALIDEDVYAVDNDRDGYIDRACTVWYDPPGSPERRKCDNCIGIYNPSQVDSHNPPNGLGDACDPPPLATNTPGPSPTPRDLTHNFPYEDNGNKDNWETDFASVLKADWKAEYWSQGEAGCEVGSWPMDTQASHEQTESRIVFPRASHDSWTTLASRPHPSISTDFCARYAENFKLNAGTYTWKVKVNADNNGASQSDRFRIRANGAVIGTLSDFDGQATNGFIEYVWNIPSNGSYAIQIEYVDQTGSAQLEVYLTGNGLTDVGECNWTNVTNDSAPGRTIVGDPAGSAFWSDSPAVSYNSTGYYQPNSTCIMRFRGVVNLAGSTVPLASWKDIHSSEITTDQFLFAVRRQGTSDWYVKTIHTGDTENWSWAERTVNLSNFDGIVLSSGATVSDIDFTTGPGSRNVEFAFIVTADNVMPTTGYGWHINDFEVKEGPFIVHPFPFTEDFESGSDRWQSETGWTTNNTAKSGSVSWSTGNISGGADNWFRLVDAVDLTLQAGAIVPELTFWHRWVFPSSTQGYVEVSDDLGETWRALRTGPSDTDDALISGVTESLSYKRVTIPLDATDFNQDYRGKRIMLRFRITTSSSTNNAWRIDDVQIRNRISHDIIYPTWCDNLNSNTLADYWLPEGTWNIQAMAGYDGGGFAFSDSPSGSYSNSQNNALYLESIINLAEENNPIVEFWHQWDLASGEVLRVEATEDDWSTSHVLWSYTRGDKPARTTSSGSWNKQVAWQRVAAPLFLFDGSGALTFPSPGNTNREIKLRFVFLSDNNNTADGWYIDNICIRDLAEPIFSVPWEDTFEDGASNWYRGGTWNIVNTGAYEGSRAITDSPSGNYTDSTDNVLELNGILNLKEVSAGIPFNTGHEPTLYYWERYNMGSNDLSYVEVLRVDENGRPISESEVWTEIQRVASSAHNDAWNRRQVDLASYIGEYVKLRFRLQALNTSSRTDGWYIDHVRFVERRSIEPVYALPYSEDAEYEADGWVKEGTWSIVQESRPIDMESALGPGQWRVDYYYDDSSYRNDATDYLPTGTTSAEPMYIGTETTSNIAFTWADGTAPPLVMNAPGRGSYGANPANWMTRYTRTVTFYETQTFTIRIRTDDGHTLRINGLEYARRNWGNGSWETHCAPYGSTCLSETSYTFLAGYAYQIVIEFFDSGGAGHAYVDFLSGGSGETVNDPLGDDPWSVTYHDWCPDNGGIVETPWNSIPEITSGIDFDYTTSVPSVVTSNNTNLAPCAANDRTWEATYWRNPNTGWQYPSNPDTFPSPTSVEVAREKLANLPNINWGGNAPEPLMAIGQTEHFFIRYVRRLVIPAGAVASQVRFQFETDDGIRLIIRQDGVATPVRDTRHWDNCSNCVVNTTYTFTQGRSYTIEVRYYENGGDAKFLSNISIQSGPDPFEYQTDIPVSSNEYWAARFLREGVMFTDPSTITFNFQSNDQVALKVRPTNTTTWTTVGTGGNTNIQHTFQPGTYDILVEYIAGSLSNGGNSISLNYEISSMVFHSDNNSGGNTPNYFDSSLILEGEILLNPGQVASLGWWDRYDIGNNQTMIVEVNEVGGQDGAAPTYPSQWDRIYERNGSTTNTQWTKRLLDLSSYSNPTQPVRLVIRFRLDAPANNNTGDGWFIDDIVVSN